MGYNKARVIGGKVLKYKATAPVSGSFRSRQMVPIGELKNVDTSISGTVNTSGTAVTLGVLNLIAQGPGQTERIGRRVTLRTLQIRLVITMQTSSVGASPFRLLVVFDRQNNAASTSVLSVVNTDTMLSFKNLSNERRFLTLMDEWIPAIGTGGPQSICVTRYIKMNNLVQEFNTGASALVSSITTGSISAFLWQNGTITTAAPEYKFDARLRYVD